MAKIIVCIMANQGGGKGAASEFMKRRYGAPSHRYSQPVREICALLGMPDTRENLQELGQHLRKVFGPAILESEIIRRCEMEPSPVAVADGGREPGDFGQMVLRPGFAAVYLDAPKEVRKARLMARGENAGEAGMSEGEFERAENHRNELAIRETVEWLRAEHPNRLHVIDNSGAWTETEKALAELFDRLLK